MSVEETHEKLAAWLILVQVGLEALKINNPELTKHDLAIVATKKGGGGKIGPQWELGTFLGDIQDLLDFALTAPSLWREGDPRDAVGKRANIAVAVDGKIFGAYVETKHVWVVFLGLNHLDRKSIGENDEWPNGWRWMYVPDPGRRT